MCYAGISTYQFIPYYGSAIHKHTHTHILKPFEDSEPTGLKVATTGESLSSLLRHVISAVGRRGHVAKFQGLFSFLHSTQRGGVSVYVDGCIWRGRCREGGGGGASEIQAREGRG